MRYWAMKLNCQLLEDPLAWAARKPKGLNPRPFNPQTLLSLNPQRMPPPCKVLLMRTGEVGFLEE